MVTRNPRTNNSTRRTVALVMPWLIPRNVEAAIMSRKYHAVSPAAKLVRISILVFAPEEELGLPRRMNPARSPAKTDGTVAAAARAIVVERSARKPSLAPFLRDSVFSS